MRGTVVVRKNRKGVPNAARDRSAALKQLRRDVKQLRRLAKAKVPKNTIRAGNDSGSLVNFALYPKRITVKAGQRVTFTMSKRSTESHTATFGPKAYLQTLSEQFQGPAGINAQTAYPSEPPPAPFTLAGASQHGSGYFNTGVLDTDKATKQIPAKAAVTFSTAGSYDFICLIHPNMKGPVVVEP